MLFFWHLSIADAIKNNKNVLFGMGSLANIANTSFSLHSL